MKEIYTEKLIYILLTVSAIIPLYFEKTSLIAGVVFFVSSIVLTFYVVKKNKGTRLTTFEVLWVLVCGLYVIVFILSFVLRPPYFQDGFWRLSSPGFILVILLWFWLTVKLEFTNLVMKLVAITSLSSAIVLFFVELKSVDFNFQGYKLGSIYSDLGGVTFILPLTGLLLGLLYLKTRKKTYSVLYFIALMLSGLTGERTSFILGVLPLLFWLSYFLFLKFNAKRAKKLVVLVVSLVILSIFVFLNKYNLEKTINSYRLAKDDGYYNTSLGLRWKMAEIGSDLFKEHWLFGVGPSYYKKAVNEKLEHSKLDSRIKRKISHYTHLHNQYLMDGIFSGVFGLSALLLVLMTPIFFTIRLFNLGKQEDALFLLGGLFAVCFVLFFGAIFTYTYTTIFYMMAIGSIFLSYRVMPENQEMKKE